MTNEATTTPVRTALSHCATIAVDVPAAQAFAFLADPVRLGEWSLGCMDTQPTDIPGVFSGRSLFDGGRGCVAIDPYPALGLIDYRVGAPTALIHRISARVMPGAAMERGDGSCLVSLIAWRPAKMADERWARLCATHEAEIFLIKAQIETRHSA